VVDPELGLWAGLALASVAAFLVALVAAVAGFGGGVLALPAGWCSPSRRCRR
jgi:membrane associated rhomboid family serine protease